LIYFILNQIKGLRMQENEMRSLKVGDKVKDIETSRNFGRDVICEVSEVRDDGIIVNAVKEEDQGGYPHRFDFDNAHDRVLLETVE